MHGKKKIWVLLVAVGWVAFGALALMAQAQNHTGTQQYAPTVKQLEATACGDFHVKFVQPDPNQDPDVYFWDEETHPLLPPVAGKAIIYVIGDFPFEPILRVGMDGTWMGALDGDTYVAFYATPGLHHLCINWQSVFADRNRTVLLKDQQVQANQTYYIRAYSVVTYYSANMESASNSFAVSSLDTSEGQLMLAQTQPTILQKAPVPYKSKKHKSKNKKKK